MFGQAGNDKLKGEGGNDRMFGGDGDDTLHGAKGRDVLSGDSGADVFLYLKAAESGPNRQKRDIIRDFGQGSDVIDVSGIDAGPGGGDQAFTFIGTNGFSNSRGELRYTNLSGGNTLIAADIDGDGAADMQIELVGTFTLSDADFVL
jgi:Ca2+-binding RTX toxin-like protein